VGWLCAIKKIVVRRDSWRYGDGCRVIGAAFVGSTMPSDVKYARTVSPI
jgi:hypothetical protein